MTHEFGTLVRTTRMAKGMSLRAFAEELGYSMAYVSDVEKGRRKPFMPDAFPKIAALLNIEEALLYTAASVSRHGAFLLPKVSARHDQVAATLAARWAQLKPKQLTAILRAVGAAS